MGFFDNFRKSDRKKTNDYIHIIMDNNPKLTEKEAKQYVEEKTIKYGITTEFFIEQELYKLTDLALDKYFSQLKVRVRVDYLAEKYNMSIGKAYNITKELNIKHNLNRTYIVLNNVFDDLSPENIAYHEDRLSARISNVVSELADITGWSEEDVREYGKRIKKKYGVGFFEIKREELYKHSDEEISRILDEKIEYDNSKRELIKRETGWDDYQVEREILETNAKYGLSNLESYCNLEFWKLPDSLRDTYALRKDSEILSEMYNTAPTKYLSNKVLFDQTYKEFLGRKFWTNKDTDIESFSEFIDGLDVVFCKPVNLLGGHGAFRYELDKPVKEMFDFFMNEPQLLVEEIPRQHHSINEIYSNCINTVRIMTALKDDKFYAYAAWIKFGAGGSIVDGRVDGGMFAAVDEKTGEIITRAVCADNSRIEVHPDSGKQILGFKIPYWDEALELTEKALRHVDGIDFVGWDLAICEDGPVIIEGNRHTAFASYQLLFSDKQMGMKYKYEFLLNPEKKSVVTVNN